MHHGQTHQRNGKEKNNGAEWGDFDHVFVDTIVIRMLFFVYNCYATLAD